MAFYDDVGQQRAARRSYRQGQAAGTIDPNQGFRQYAASQSPLPDPTAPSSDPLVGQGNPAADKAGQLGAYKDSLRSYYGAGGQQAADRPVGTAEPMQAPDFLNPQRAQNIDDRIYGRYNGVAGGGVGSGVGGTGGGAGGKGQPAAGGANTQFPTNPDAGGQYHPPDPNDPIRQQQLQDWKNQLRTGFSQTVQPNMPAPDWLNPQRADNIRTRFQNRANAANTTLP